MNGTLLNATNTLINATLANASSAAKDGLLHKLLNPVALAFILPVLLVAVIMTFVLRNVAPVSHFLYANARIQARTNYMVSASLLRDLTKASSLKEFRSLLADTTYGEALEKSKEGLRPFHIALEKSFVDSILELVELSPKKSQPLFDAYLKFSEAKILKIIYRAKMMKQDIDESLVYPIGNISQNLLKHLIGMETIADMAVVMEPTAYSEIFKQKYESLEEFEVKIDEFVFNNFIDTIKKTKMYDGKYIIYMLNKKIDVLNILALLKLRIRGIEKEKQKNLLVNNKTDLCLRFNELFFSYFSKAFFNGV